MEQGSLGHTSINTLITMMMIAILDTNNSFYVIVFCSLLLTHLCVGQQIVDAAHQINDTSSFRRVELNAVTITAKYLTNRNNSYQYLPQNTKSLITVMGGSDVIRYIGTLPGVSQGMEGGMGFFIRGGNNANNRIELDGVPVYGSTHLFGLFSTFHADMVQSTSFRTGGISASSGDFLASITQIKSLTPDTAGIHGSFNISPFLIGLSANGHINKKIGYVVAGRMSLLRPEYLLIKSISKAETDVNPQISDLFLKFNYAISQQHIISASAYHSNDYFSFNNSTVLIGMNWGNQFARIGWDWSLSDKTKLQTLAYYNRFYSGQLQKQFNDNTTNDLMSELRVQSALSENVLQTTLVYEHKLWSLQAGLLYKKRQFHPVSQKMLIGQDTVANLNNPLMSNSFVLFSEVKFKYSDLFTTLGVRVNMYNANRSTSLLMDFRLNTIYEMSAASGLEFSYDLLSQTHHAVEGLPVGWSLDLLVPADSVFLPEIAHQFYAGGYWGNKILSLSAGVYFKQMNNLISYKSSANLFGNQSTSWQQEIAAGVGRSYGFELRVEHKSSKWNAELSYTLSRTTRKYKELNDGAEFPFKFDRTHILNLHTQFVTVKQREKKQDFNVTLSFSSGHKATIPIAMYKGELPPFWNLMGDGAINGSMDENAYSRQLMSEVNNYKLHNYFRIDIGYRFLKKRKKSTSELTVGVCNVLNRKNPYLIFYQNESWKQLSILPVIPSAQWSVTF